MNLLKPGFYGKRTHAKRREAYDKYLEAIKLVPEYLVLILEKE